MILPLIAIRDAIGMVVVPSLARPPLTWPNSVARSLNAPAILTGTGVTSGTQFATTSLAWAHWAAGLQLTTATLARAKSAGIVFQKFRSRASARCSAAGPIGAQLTRAAGAWNIKKVLQALACGHFARPELPCAATTDFASRSELPSTATTKLTASKFSAAPRTRPHPAPFPAWPTHRGRSAAEITTATEIASSAPEIAAAAKLAASPSPEPATTASPSAKSASTTSTPAAKTAAAGQISHD